MKAANKSPFVEELLEIEKRRCEPEIFYPENGDSCSGTRNAFRFRWIRVYHKAMAAYTPEVQAETLKLNEATPFASE
jgi:hypothetical protein